MHRVVITGIGWITPMGTDIDGVWGRLLAGETGIANTTLFDASTFPTRIGSEVKTFQMCDHVKDCSRHEGAGRSTQFALAAASQAWAKAKLDGVELDFDRVGIYFAGGEGSLDMNAFTTASLTAWNAEAGKIDTVKWAETAVKLMNPVKEYEQEPNAALVHLAMLTGARGPALNCLTACAAGTQAIGEATEILRRGDADVMITGGAHSMIHPFGVTGFNRLTALSTANDNPRSASRPFELNRAGFVLGEGSGVVILETLEHAQKRGATILAEVAGYGSTADAFRITDQHPEGTGAVIAMKEALADAKLEPSAVDYINAHGTGTRENDGNETSAIKQVFGDYAKKVPISSVKSMMGHLIAAAGAMETICCVLALRDQKLPPTMNMDTPDPECDLDYVPNKTRDAKVDVVMSNKYGFGGQNDTIILKRFA
ncbi:MAG: beta-ketoacyl-[acyl-carrier-protein] synthase family protein [Tepidisphaeraceae bacterium]